MVEHGKPQGRRARQSRLGKTGAPETPAPGNVQLNDSAPRNCSSTNGAYMSRRCYLDPPTKQQRRSLMLFWITRTRSRPPRHQVIAHFSPPKSPDRSSTPSPGKRSGQNRCAPVVPVVRMSSLIKILTASSTVSAGARLQSRCTSPRLAGQAIRDCRCAAVGYGNVSPTHLSSAAVDACGEKNQR